MDTPDEYEATALDNIERIAAMTNDEVRRAYLERDQDCGTPYVEALVAELQSRNIDV
jgi:hypothetical protein